MKIKYLVGVALSITAFGSAQAAPILTKVGADFGSAPYTLTSGDSSFTFSGTGDFFAPTAIATGGTGQVNTVFGEPTTNFIDRGTVTFGADKQYAAFPTTTPIRFSNGGNFIGLLATLGGQTFYGFAYTTNNVLNSYGFESVAGQTITATAAVPEPASWAMMALGFGALGFALRKQGRQVAAAL